MKKCPFCAEDIQDAAVKCRHCGSMLDQPTLAAATSRSTTVRGRRFGVVFLLILGVFAYVAYHLGDYLTRPAPTPPAFLALTAMNGYESASGGYYVVEGSVKNISDRSLKHVMAVAIWSDKDGEFIKSDIAVIGYNPILPGQTSPFKTMSIANPAMSKYRVEFKSLFGGTLAFDDQRKK